jgi:hypothetical protein
MTQYDAGPGDWSDREWEAPAHKQKPQAKRRLTLPPWALVAAAVVISILLCVGLVLVVRAIRGEPKGTPTALQGEATSALGATATFELAATTTPQTPPTATAQLPITPSAGATVYTEVAVGATVVVQGTAAAGLNLRAEPGGQVVAAVKEKAELVVLEGPQQANGLTWWKVRTADGKEGWVAGQFLVLKP